MVDIQAPSMNTQCTIPALCVFPSAKFQVYFSDYRYNPQTAQTRTLYWWLSKEGHRIYFTLCSAHAIAHIIHLFFICGVTILPVTLILMTTQIVIISGCYNYYIQAKSLYDSLRRAFECPWKVWAKIWHKTWQHKTSPKYHNATTRCLWAWKIHTSRLSALEKTSISDTETPISYLQHGSPKITVVPITETSNTTQNFLGGDTMLTVVHASSQVWSSPIMRQRT